MIIRHFPVPDLTKRALPGGAGRPAHFYSLTRIESLESNDPDVALDLEASKMIGERLRQSKMAKKEAMVAVVSQIRLPQLSDPIEPLLEQVRKSNSLFLPDRELHRLALANLLDTLESSVNALANYSWHAGVCEARKLLRDRMLMHIARTYPLLELAAEEQRQAPSG